MKKYTIPTILAATILVAGMFAFQPVEQASTVHTSGLITVADNSIDADAIADNAIDAGAFAANAIGELEIDDAIAPQVVPLAACANLFDTDISGGNAVTATVDKDFTLYVLATGTNADTLDIAIAGATYQHTFTTNDLSHSFVIHAESRQLITLTGSTADVDVNMTIMSQDGAAGDCLA